MADEEAARTGQELFWLRITAAAIDLLALVIVAHVAAAALYWASDGRLRSSTLGQVAHCQPMATAPRSLVEGVAAPPGARPVAAQMCAISTAGFETGRYATVALQAQQGEVVRSVAFSRPVDRHGNPLRPVILDWTYPLAFILALSLAEALAGVSLGKRLVGLKVVAAGGGRLPLGRALLRNLVVWGGAALLVAAPLAAAVMGLRLSQAAYYAAVAVLGLLILAPAAMLIQARPRALYDRWAGAEVVRR